MPRISLNLGDLIAAFFGMPGPSAIKSLGANTLSGLADEALGAADEIVKPTTVTEDLDKLFEDIRVFNKDPLSAAKLPTELTDLMQPPERGGSETLSDLLQMLRGFNK